MNAKRLLKLADVLDTVPRKKFDFRVIFNADRGPACRSSALNSCGAVGCAIGWANTVPSFRRAGFKIENLAAVDPWEEAVKLFDLTGVYQAHELFMPIDSGTFTHSGLPETATPKQVAKHIRKFVRDHETA